MAQQTVVEYTDDYTGKALSAENKVTREVIVDGVSYRFDLSAKSSAELDKTLNPWTSLVQGTRVVVSAKTHKGARMDRGQAKALREWAQRNGFDIGTRGRISEEIQEAYRNAGK